MEDHEFVNYLLDVEHPISGRKGVPHVLISGAGLGGLFLAILLEEAGISYIIFERSRDIRPLGTMCTYGCSVYQIFFNYWSVFTGTSHRPRPFTPCISNLTVSFLSSCVLVSGAVMALSANILPVFEQLGLYEALMNFAKPINSIRLMNNGLKKLGDITGQDEKDL